MTLRSVHPHAPPVPTVASVDLFGVLQPHDPITAARSIADEHLTLDMAHVLATGFEHDGRPPPPGVSDGDRPPLGRNRTGLVPQAVCTKHLNDRKRQMPQFWKLDALQWLNPEHIVHVEDAPHAEPPTLRVKMVTLEPTVQGSAAEPYTVELTGEARDKVLAYLTRETESPPPPPPA